MSSKRSRGTTTRARLLTVHKKTASCERGCLKVPFGPRVRRTRTADSRTVPRDGRVLGIDPRGRRGTRRRCGPAVRVAQASTLASRGPFRACPELQRSHRNGTTDPWKARLRDAASRMSSTRRPERPSVQARAAGANALSELRPSRPEAPPSRAAPERPCPRSGRRPLPGGDRRRRALPGRRGRHPGRRPTRVVRG